MYKLYTQYNFEHLLEKLSSFRSLGTHIFNLQDLAHDHLLLLYRL